MDSFLKGMILGLVISLVFWYLPVTSNRVYKIHERLDEIKKVLIEIKDK